MRRIHIEAPLRILLSDGLAIVRFTGPAPRDAEGLLRMELFLGIHAIAPLVMFDVKGAGELFPELLHLFQRLHDRLTSQGDRVVFCGLPSARAPLAAKLRDRGLMMFSQPLDDMAVQTLGRSHPDALVQFAC